jgi:type I restriction enzyme S subunit
VGLHLRKYLRVANVFEDRLDLGDVKEMNFTPEEFEIYRLIPGDLLLNEGQSLDLVGRPAMFRGELPDVCFQNTLIRFRAGPGLIPDFALLVFRHYLHSGAFRQIARRSTNIAHLGFSRFVEMPFPLPPRVEQERIIVEARRRLESSKAQEAAIRTALARLTDMEQEVVAAAVAGHLIPQDETDEPADALLVSVDTVPAPDSPRVATRSGKTGVGLPAERKKKGSGSGSGSVGGIRPLAEVLREVRRPILLPELFTLAGYNRDSTEQIEQFYLALRDALGSTVRIADTGGENALLEATNAP